MKRKTHARKKTSYDFGTHFVSGSCRGEDCGPCARADGFVRPATHKLGEEIPHDDPNPNRHNLTQYVCCRHFKLIVGPAAPCERDD